MSFEIEPVRGWETAWQELPIQGRTRLQRTDGPAARLEVEPVRLLLDGTGPTLALVCGVASIGLRARPNASPAHVGSPEANRRATGWVRPVLWHGLAVGLALALWSGVGWGVLLWRVRGGGYYAIEPLDIVMDAAMLALALVCGVALAALRGRA
jgi:hypothetical protein